MELKELILKLAKEQKAIKTSDILVAFKQNVSRQYVSRIIRQLVTEGELIKTGTTNKTFYSLPENIEYAITARGDVFKRRLRNKNLKEHEVLMEINNTIAFIKEAPENIKGIFDYAFSEMLNNAIEHSKSEYIEVEVSKVNNNLVFIVSDFGIGVFINVMKKKSLNSELEAIQDLMKGKTTTEPQAHSGEGIFFTSKAADIFVLDSFEHSLRVDNTLPDLFILSMKHPKKGTKVTFSIGLASNRHLSHVFKKFQTKKGELGFDKTDIKIRLFTMGTIYVSRSQARRVLIGLEKFKHIILDYAKVPTIGQAFADEIYRVFQSRFPGIEIESVNTNEAVQFMINRVDKPKTLF